METIVGAVWRSCGCRVVDACDDNVAREEGWGREEGEDGVVKVSCRITLIRLGGEWVVGSLVSGGIRLRSRASGLLLVLPESSRGELVGDVIFLGDL